MTRAGFWLGDQPLILASRSAARRGMLEAAAIPHEAQPADIDERAIEEEARRNGADARSVALALAQAKAARIAARNPGRTVLGSDQTLDLDGAVLSKPVTRDRAIEQLRRLAGRPHRLWSAAVVMQDAEMLCDVVAGATLHLRSLSAAMIETYLAAVGPDVLDCAGTYQLEGAGVHIFASTEGDYWTILGLPLLQLCERFRALGLLAHEAAMIVIGLTGSIGMGKSATADMFRARGVPVHDSDAAVHALYRGELVPIIEAAFPGTTHDGMVDRALLGAQVIGDEARMRSLEALVHPRVWKAEADYIAVRRREGFAHVVVDNPLLFEARDPADYDAIVVCSAAPDIQRARVLARPGMNVEKFEAILKRQIPDDDKRRRAHYVIDTGRGFAAAQTQVDGVLRALAAG